MEHGIGHGRAHVFRSPAGRAVAVVRQRLGSAVEHQADAHTGSEHHGNPRRRGKLRFLINVAQLDGAKFRGSDEDNEGHEDGAKEHVGPTELIDDPRQGRGRKVREVIRRGKAPNNDGGNKHTSDTHDGPVNRDIIAVCGDFDFRIVILFGVEPLRVDHVLDLARRRLLIQRLFYRLIILNRLIARSSRSGPSRRFAGPLPFFGHTSAVIFSISHAFYIGGVTPIFQTTFLSKPQLTHIFERFLKVSCMTIGGISPRRRLLGVTRPGSITIR